MDDGGTRTWALGLAAGAIAGALDVALIAVADPGAGPWVWLQSFFAWLACGTLVVVARGPAGADLGVAIGATLLANLAWFVALGPALGHVEHVGPLVAMSVVFGVGFGLARRWARRSDAWPSP